MISKINDTINVVKNALDINMKLVTADQQNQLADAKYALADIKEAYLPLREENIRLKQKLRNNKAIKYNRDGAIVLDDGLWCSGCYGAKDRLVRLSTYGSIYKCPVCEALYGC